MSTNPFIIGPKIGVIDEQNDGSTYGDNMRQVLRMLQALLQPNIINMTTSVPPAAPTNGDTYVVASGPSGLWAGQANNIAYWTLDSPLSPGGVWEFWSPLNGWLVLNRADGFPYIFNGAAWVKFVGGSGGGALLKWPGNWIGFNSAGVIDENPESANIGATFILTGAGSGTVPPTATQPQAVDITAGDVGFEESYGVLDSNVDLSPGIVQDWFAKVALVGETFSRYWLGFSDVNHSSVDSAFNTNTPAANFIGFRYSAGTDVDIVAVCQTDAAHQTIVSTGIAPTFSVTPQVFEIVPTDSGATITFYIDGVLVATIATTVPPASIAMGSLVVLDGQDNVGSVAEFHLFYLYILLNS